MEDNMKNISIANENADQVNFQNKNLELADLKLSKSEEQVLPDDPKINIDKASEITSVESGAERDPFGVEQNSQKSNNLQAAINLFKSYIGGGILALPYIFFKTGYVLSTFALLLTAGLVFYSTMLLLELVHDTSNKPSNVTEVFKRTMGRKATLLYKFFLASYQLGICVSYAIFFTDFFQIAFDTGNMPSSRIIFACFSLSIIFPLSMIDNFHFFVKFSNIGNILIIITLIAIIQLDFTHMNKQELEASKHNLGTITHLPSFIGVSIFAFECIGNIFPIKNSMKNPEKFKNIFSIVSMIICVIYVLFSVICCISLGSKVNQIILMDLEKIQSFFYIFQAFYAIALILSYPIQFYPLVIIIEDIRLIKRIIIDASGKYNYKRYLIRFVLTLVVFALAFAIPKFASFLNFIGAFSGINIQFVFPIIAYHNTFKLIAPKWKIYLNIFVLLLGIVGSGFGVYDSLKELTKN